MSEIDYLLFYNCLVLESFCLALFYYMSGRIEIGYLQLYPFPKFKKYSHKVHIWYIPYFSIWYTILLYPHIPRSISVIKVIRSISVIKLL